MEGEIVKWMEFGEVVRMEEELGEYSSRKNEVTWLLLMRGDCRPLLRPPLMRMPDFFLRLREASGRLRRAEPRA